MMMEYVRLRYGVPVKRGGVIRESAKHENTGRVLSASDYVFAMMSNGKRLKYHPFDLDYLVDGEWVLASDLQKRYKAKEDRFVDETTKKIDKAFDLFAHALRRMGGES